MNRTYSLHTMLWIKFYTLGLTSCSTLCDVRVFSVVIIQEPSCFTEYRESIQALNL